MNENSIKMKELISNRSFMLFLLSVLFFLIASTSTAFAAAMSIGAVAANVTSSMADLAKLITAAAYVGGFGFAVGAILKFKAHKDNPQQITVGTPITFLFVAAALIFLPSIFAVTGKTMFDSNAKQGTVKGVKSFS